MPVINFERLHPETRMRKPRSDCVAYYMIGDQTPINFEIPPLLQSPLLGMLPFLPKSGLQYLNPLEYQKEHIRTNGSQAVRFGVIFSQNFAAWADQVLAEPALLHVFLWQTTKRGAIERLVRVTQPKLILVPNENVAQKLLKAGITTKDMPPDRAAIYRRIEERVREEAHIDVEAFQERVEQAAEFARAYHKDHFPRRTLPFSPLRNNVAQMAQLFAQFDEDLWEILPNEHGKRAEELAASFRGIAEALHFVRVFPNRVQQELRPPPAAIMAFPSINPMVIEQWKRAAKKLPSKLKRLAKVIVSARVAEQDTNSYLNYPNIEGIRDKRDLEIVAQFGVRQLASYTHFFDMVGYLHASFGAAPYVRAPIKGGSLAEQHRYFSPDQYIKNPSSLEICERVHEFGSTLGNAIHPALRNALREYPGGVVAMSDLPVEWMDLGGMPFCFAHDLCRLPEGAPTNLLSQYSRNQTSTFRITAETPKRTLVVCGALDDDPISKSFKGLQEFHAEQNEPMPHLVRCTSLDEFYGIVNEFRPELLIIDSHGRFVHNDAGTEITFGEEHLDGFKVIRYLPQIPLVFLSACWGAPLYGCPNTIAHAFFEAGSFAVTASLLPVDVLRGGILYTRILRNLAEASRKPLHPHWSSFVSHTVRTSYLTDLDALVRHRLGVMPEEQSWVERRGKWFTATMFPSTREEAFREAHDVVASCYDKDLVPAVKEILATKEYLPEFMFYSTMGRADLVQFDAWNQKFHAAANDALTVREMKARLEQPQAWCPAGTKVRDLEGFGVSE